MIICPFLSMPMEDHCLVARCSQVVFIAVKRIGDLDISESFRLNLGPTSCGLLR